MKIFNIISITVLCVSLVIGAFAAKYGSSGRDMFDFDKIDRTKINIVAEGGNAMYAPENTLAAFRQAVNMGSDMVLIDVRVTSDKCAVAMRDAFIDRTTSGSGPVSGLSFGQLKSYSAGYKSVFGDVYESETVPALSEVFSVLKNKPCIINVFNTIDISFVREEAAIARYSESSITILLDNVKDIGVIKKNMSKIKFFLNDPLNEYISQENRAEWIENVKKTGVDGFLINYNDFFELSNQDRGTLAILMSRNDIYLYLYGIRYNSDIDKAMSFQVKGKVKNKTYTGKLSGIVTDDPAKALMVAGKLKIK